MFCGEEDFPCFYDTHGQCLINARVRLNVRKFNRVYGIALFFTTNWQQQWGLIVGFMAK